jgi:hypothetical protein
MAKFGILGPEPVASTPQSGHRLHKVVSKIGTPDHVNFGDAFVVITAPKMVPASTKFSKVDVQRCTHGCVYTHTIDLTDVYTQLCTHSGTNHITREDWCVAFGFSRESQM